MQLYAFGIIYHIWDNPYLLMQLLQLCILWICLQCSHLCYTTLDPDMNVSLASCTLLRLLTAQLAAVRAGGSSSNNSSLGRLQQTFNGTSGGANGTLGGGLSGNTLGGGGSSLTSSLRAVLQGGGASQSLSLGSSMRTTKGGPGGTSGHASAQV